MSNPKQVARLLGEVRKVASPSQRMKVLARAWRTLRRLTPSERAKLASEVGIDGAEEIVERMASKYGRLKPAVILQALERARSAEPGQLQDLFAGLRDPRRRGQILKRGMEAVVRELDPAPPAELRSDASSDSAEPEAVPAAVRPAATQSAESQPAAPPDSPEDPSVKPTVASSKRAAGGVVGAVGVAGAAHRASKPAERPSRPAPTAPAVAPPPQRSVPQPQPPVVPSSADGTAVPGRPEIVGKSPSRATPQGPGQRQKSSTQPSASPVETAPAALPPDTLVQRVHAAKGLVRQLKTLRELAPQAGRLDRGDVERLLDGFAADWARRRALNALLEARLPTHLDDALALIAQLESGAGRRWCLGTILDVWSLARRQREEVQALRRDRGTPAVSFGSIGLG